MLSKFQRREKGSRNKSNNNPKIVQNFMATDLQRLESRETKKDKETILDQKRKKRIKWHKNPLYMVKEDESTDFEDWDAYSHSSSVSKASATKSLHSIDSGYKSDPDVWTEWLSKWFSDATDNKASDCTQTEDFRCAAVELLETVKSFGGQLDVNNSIAQTLKACEFELIKIAISENSNSS